MFVRELQNFHSDENLEGNVRQTRWRLLGGIRVTTVVKYGSGV